MLSHNSSNPGSSISRDASPALPLPSSTLTSVWNLPIRFFEWFGDLGFFAWQVLRSAVRRPFEGRELLRQLDEIGSRSFPLVALAGGALGGGPAFGRRSRSGHFWAQ